MCGKNLTLPIRDNLFLSMCYDENKRLEYEKINFILGILFLFMGCSQKEAVNLTRSDIQCSISGQDCWLIIQNIKHTDRLCPQGQEEKECSYQNTALKAYGLSVTHHEIFKDGGSERYTLSNGVNIFKNFRIGSQENGYTTVSWPNKRSVTFDRSGHAIKQTVAED